MDKRIPSTKGSASAKKRPSKEMLKLSVGLSSKEVTVTSAEAISVGWWGQKPVLNKKSESEAGK